MGLLDGVARLLLVIINIVFLLAGLGITAVGFILRYGRTVYQPFLETGINQLQKVLEKTSLGDYDVKSIDIGQVVMSLSIGLIIGGLCLVALSFLGCCGACCKIKILLWLYAIVIIVFVVGEAVAIGLLYGKPEIVKKQLKNSLNDYGGLGSSDVFSVGWNIIMIQFQCCGVDNYEDFQASTKWNADPTKVKLKTPVACCKELPSDPNLKCAADGTFVGADSNFDKGCYQTLWDLSFGNKAIAIPVLVICGIIQVVFILFAIMIAKSDDNKISPI